MTLIETAKMAADGFLRTPLDYSFGPNELIIIQKIFSNSTKRVFLLRMLPPNVAASLTAMYSRMNNKRGIRGIFVDKFVPEFLAATIIDEAGSGEDIDVFLKRYEAIGEGALERLLQRVPESQKAFHDFLMGIGDVDYLEKVANAKRVRSMLGKWLDAYGHNSIARMSASWLCFEGVSLLTIKVIEECRLGAGYVELSTRYVEIKRPRVFPLDFLGLWSPQLLRTAENLQKQLLNTYGDIQGPFTDVLTTKYSDIMSGKDLTMGVKSDVCDAGGNFLPLNILSSVGVCMMGEALNRLLQHLGMEGTPECLALRDLIIDEIGGRGPDQFTRHSDPTINEKRFWGKLDADQIIPRPRIPHCQAVILPDRAIVEATIVDTLRLQGFPVRSIGNAIELIKESRMEYDKLPRLFEMFSVVARGAITMRSWRDLQRHTTTLNLRSKVSPYEFWNPRKYPELVGVVDNVKRAAIEYYEEARKAGVPANLIEYGLPMGCGVHFVMALNLRAAEFICHQRTGSSVNDEVREFVLLLYQLILDAYPWWLEIARADLIKSYVFSRGSKIPFLE